MAVRGSVETEWAAKKRPQPFSRVQLLDAVPRRRLSRRRQGAGRGRCSRPGDAAPAATSPGSGSPPTQPGGGAPAPGGRAGRGGAGRERAAGGGRRLLGCQREAGRARGGARAGRSRGPGAAVAGGLGECPIHPPPRVPRSGLRRRDPLVSPAAAALRGRW